MMFFQIASLFFFFLGIRAATLLARREEWRRLFSTLLYFSCALFLALTGFLLARFGKDQPLMKVIITGNHRKEWVEWKNPQHSLQRKRVQSYEVRLENLEGKELGSYFLWGDQVALRARVLRFPPFLQLLGVANFCRIDRLHSEYFHTQDYNAGPHGAVDFAPSPVTDILWKVWEACYFQGNSWNLIRAATLETQALPLRTPGAYLLTVTESGLGCFPQQTSPQR